MTRAPRMRLRVPGRAVAGVADQAVIAIGNLAIGLLVLRLSTKDGYGLYTLAYMGVLLGCSFAGAFFSGPMIADHHRRTASERVRCAATTLRGQIAAALAMSGLLSAAALAARDDGIASHLLLATALACPGALTQDFLRGYLFLTGRGGTALALDVALLCLWPLAIGLLLAGGASPPVAAVLAFGLATAAVGAAGLAIVRLPVGDWRAPLPLARFWREGRWTLGGATISALQNQAHVYLAGALASAAAVAEMNAARMLLMPLGLVMLGANRTLVPEMARLLAEGRRDRAQRLSRWVLGAVLLAITAYASLLVLFEPLLARTVLGPRYAGLGPLVALWALVTFLQAIDLSLSAWLQVARRFRTLAMLGLWTSVPVLVCVVPMLLAYGVEGGLIVLAGGYAAMTLLLWRAIRQDDPTAERGLPVRATVAAGQGAAR